MAAFESFAEYLASEEREDPTALTLLAAITLLAAGAVCEQQAEEARIARKAEREAKASQP